ncbi:MAG TPA: hypothetical protein VHG70_12620, partial [Nocardioidaceae bacterium]|nr:hypothetical protein [Nocardioidaceae bacterium]
MTINLSKARSGLAVAALLLYAAVASLATPLSLVASVAVLVPGVITLVVASTRRTRADIGLSQGRLSRTALAWGGVVALTALWDLAAWLAQPAYNVA